MGNEISSFIEYLQHTNKYSKSKAHAVHISICPPQGRNPDVNFDLEYHENQKDKIQKESGTD